MTSRGLVLAALLISACGSGSPAPATPSSAGAAGSPTREDRLAEINRWIDRMWSAYVRADLEPYRDTLAKDLFSWGTSVGVTFGFDAALADARSDFANFAELRKRGVKLEYHDIGRHVGLTPDGDSAWVITEKEVVVTHPGGTSHMALIATALLSRRQGTWKKVHSHSGARIPLFAIRAIAKQGKLPRPEPIKDQIGSGSERIAASFRAAAGSFGALAGAIGTSESVQLGFGVVGTYVTGTKAREGLSRLAKNGPKITVDHLRAHLASRDLGWVSANVTAAFGDFSTPFRISAGYVKRDKTWELVQLHLSFAHGQPPPLIAGARVYDCSEERNMRSSGRSEAALLRVRNVSKNPVQLHWLDERGKRQLAAKLDPGGESLHKSSTSHLYVLTDDNGDCLRIYQPGDGMSAAVYIDR